MADKNDTVYTLLHELLKVYLDANAEFVFKNLYRHKLKQIDEELEYSFLKLSDSERGLKLRKWDVVWILQPARDRTGPSILILHEVKVGNNLSHWATQLRKRIVEIDEFVQKDPLLAEKRFKKIFIFVWVTDEYFREAKEIVEKLAKTYTDYRFALLNTAPLERLVEPSLEITLEILQERASQRRSNELLAAFSF